MNFLSDEDLEISYAEESVSERFRLGYLQFKWTLFRPVGNILAFVVYYKYLFYLNLSAMKVSEITTLYFKIIP